VQTCNDCPSYNKGAGSRQCLICRKYKHFQLNSGSRRTTFEEITPQAILEQIADLKGRSGEDIVAAIRKLPPDLSSVLSLRYLSGMTNEEVARALHISIRTTRYRISAALTQVKQIAAL
jgi:RNA polymerase sigma factor (sigma-70 family)